MSQKQSVLVVGGGGREHALALLLSRSSHVERVFCAPGNGGTEAFCTNLPIMAGDIDNLIRFSRNNGIGLVVVGPEEPLVNGIVNAFESEGILVFGPTREAAQLEGSKLFMHEIAATAGIPTARYQAFYASEYEQAIAYLGTVDVPIVVKADGLAAGKGVYVCQNRSEARQALKELMLDGMHGKAGKKVLIEECLVGPEISIHVICDGNQGIMLLPSQDYKRVRDSDEGPNTGGMGVVTPLPFVSEELLTQIQNTIVNPFLSQMREIGAPYVGCLYPGLVLTKEALKSWK